MEQVVSAKKTNVLLQFGLMSAVASILIFVVLYLGGTSFFSSPVAFLAYLVPVVFSVLACRKAKQENEGYLEFRTALKITFGIFVLTTLGSTIVSYFIFNFLDTGFAESMKQVTIEKTQEFMVKFNVPQDQIDKAINKMITENIYSLGNLIKAFFQGCIVWFIVSLIIAAIMKKKKPVFSE
jgi:hypothetical protein